MRVPKADSQIVRELARRVADIAARPEHEALRREWIRHNRLEQGRPMIRVSPEGSWCELIPEASLECSSDTGRQYERDLRQRIYRWEQLKDDVLIAPTVFALPAVRNTGWGIVPQRVGSGEERGSWAYDPPLREPSDFARMEPPRVEIAEVESARRVEALAEVFGDILPVKLARQIWDLSVDTNLVDTLVSLRGNRQLLEDMHDRPEWVHEVMTFMTESTLELLDSLEEHAALDLNNDITPDGLGGYYCTDELPAPGFDGAHVRLHDLWGVSDAQEFAGVSPQMHYDFGIRYQKRILDRFGLNCYGCCEPLDRKLDFVKQIPRLRRVSVSPWADVRRAVEGLRGAFIFSWRPNPACVAGDTFHQERIRAEIRETIAVCREFGCVLEILLKDTHTVREEPQRLKTWIETAKEERE